MLDALEIQKILPHRYPFLLVDQMLEMEAGVRGVGLKNVTINEPFFQGHFPNYPVMPGVLIIEAMAQVGAIAVLSMPEYEGRIAVLAGIKEAKFRRQVKPGDTLRLEVTIERLRATFGIGRGVAYVGDEIAAEGQIMFSFA